MAVPPDLTELQLAVLRFLWRKGEASVAEVQAGLPDRELAITTVATILQRLERRGIVAHRSEGRQFVYRSLVDEPAVRRSMLGAVVRSVFSGDPAALVSQLLTSDDVSAADLRRIHELLEESRSRRRR
jgi:BlaI family transcriptional regulator, penicillinase repressor